MPGIKEVLPKIINHECDGNEASSIFTLSGGGQLFWAAFDLILAVVPLKVALGLAKIDF